LGPRADSQPARAYCYQEDTGVVGSKRYGLHCHTELAGCESARGPNSKRQQSSCQAIDLGDAGKLLTLRGWGGSWYALQAAPFTNPFPVLGK